jgi:hypothetical protein
MMKKSEIRNPKSEIAATDETRMEHGIESVFNPCFIRGSLSLGFRTLGFGYYPWLALLAVIVPLSFSRDAQRSAAADQGDSAWGTIKGHIVYDGDPVPEPKALNITKDQEHCLGKGPILSEDWVVNKKNKGVRWTFVWLTPEPGGASLPIHPSLKDIPNKEVEIDQPRCAFVPHCLAMREGQVLVTKNSSPTTHNVHWTGTQLKNPGGNNIIPAGGTVKIEGLKEDKFPLLVDCNIHPWMKARVAVFAHPYFAVTDENGYFEIKLAPAGEHRLKVYHESVGWRGGAEGRLGEKITVKGGGVTDLGNLGLKPSD